MRGIDLPRVPDDAINDNQILVLDDPTQSFSMKLAQLKKFLGIGENSILIPPGTDIHVYFKTAKSGQYYGENLTNTAQSGAWHAFDWVTHNQGSGTLTEITNTNELAIHTLAGGAWTMRAIISSSGGVVDDLTIRSTAPILTLEESDTGKKYFFIADASNFRINKDSPGASTGGVSILSFIDETNEVVFPGKVITGDYENFNERYIQQDFCTFSGFASGNADEPYMRHKTSNTVVRLALKNTAGKGANSWFQDTNTGMIFQAGFNPSANGNVSTVNFPIAFPTACVSVNNTVIYPDQGNEINMSKLQAPATLTNFIAGNDQHGSYWFAVGYSGTTGTQKDFDHLAHFGFEEPAYFYSAINNAFYPSSLFNAYAAGDGWPDDVVMVDDEIYLEYAANRPPKGKERIAGADGMPAWGDEVFLELTPAQHQAKKNALLKKAGGEIDALRDVVKHLANTEQYADSLEEWERYRAAVYVATPEEAVKIPLPE